MVATPLVFKVCYELCLEDAPQSSPRWQVVPSIVSTGGNPGKGRAPPLHSQHRAETMLGTPVLCCAQRVPVLLSDRTWHPRLQSEGHRWASCRRDGADVARRHPSEGSSLAWRGWTLFYSSLQLVRGGPPQQGVQSTSLQVHPLKGQSHPKSAGRVDIYNCPLQFLS